MLMADDTAEVHGLMATSPVRTVVDVAGLLHPTLLGKIVDFALRGRLCTEEDLERHVVQLGGRGRRGTAQLRRILSDRTGGDSALEARWLRVLQGAGLRPTALQHQLMVGSRVFLLDFAWPERRVGVEADGSACSCRDEPPTGGGSSRHEASGAGPRGEK